MNILAVDHTAIAASDRGLYRELAEMTGVSLALLVPGVWKEHYGKVHSDPEWGPMEVYSTRTLFSGRSHRALYLSLGGLLRQMRPDILYVNAEPESYLGWQAVVFRKKASPDTRVVIDSWRNMTYRRFPYKLAWIHSRIEKSVLAQADHCIGHNGAAKEIFGMMGFDRVTVIPPPVDTRLFTPRDRPPDSGPFRIGFVGRFIEEKGGEMLLRAAARLRFPLQLVFVGDGPAKRAWQTVAHKEGIASRVEWKGPVAHAAVPGILRSMDLLVLPSRSGSHWKEQFGRILIEAMACGVPVVGSGSGEIPSVIGDGGLVFPEGETDALAQAILQMHDREDLRKECVVRGLARVKEHFTIPVIARKYHDVFRNLLRRSAQPEGRVL